MKIKSMLKNKKGVFGLTAVQAFFAIILGIALLAYVIVIIMGTLNDTAILTKDSATKSEETGGWLNTSKDGGYVLDKSTLSGFSDPVITTVKNATLTIAAGNYTLVGNTLKNATVTNFVNINVTYTYKLNSLAQNDLNSVLINTSTGITGFFSSVSPVYAILAILVIILVLTVLVRVVQSPSKQETTPQL